MDAYTLKSDEIQLFRDTGTLIDHDTVRLIETVDYELLLTNQNIVIIKTIKKMFSKPQSEFETYPVESIKIYNDKPQVKQNRNTVEFFLTTGEIKFSFHSNTSARKLVTQVYNLLTGTSVADRGADKVKGAINRVDDTLGISTVGTVKTVLENGIARTLLGGFGSAGAKQTTKQAVATGALHIIKGIADSKKSAVETEVVSDTPESMIADETAEPVKAETVTEPPNSGSPAISDYNERLELITKMKSLVDAGILTQDEFDAKKKELLQL